MHDMIGSVDAQWKVLVTDPASLKVLSAACKMFDILDGNVTLVEDVLLKRQPYVDMDAIYFLSSTEESVNAAIDDYKSTSLYKNAHFFFISGVPDFLFKKITSSKAANRIKSFKELYVDFIAFESQVFTLDCPTCFSELYSSDTKVLMSTLDKLAKQIVSVCATLNDIPAVRYGPCYSINKISSKLATLVQEHLDSYSQSSGLTSGSEKSTLIVLDRSFDVLTPFIHEFTYQAMSNDLLKIEKGNRYSYTMHSGSEDKQRDVVLDESDSVWVDLRHTHIADCISQIIGNFNKFISENKAVKTSKKSGDSSVSSLAEMKETLNALPQLQEMKGKFSLHLTIAQECMAEFEKQQLALIAGVEQNMATGYTAEGSEVKNILPELLPLLSNPSISYENKVRLLMIYVTTRDGIEEADRKKLLEAAKLSANDAILLTNLGLMGVKLQKDKFSSGADKKKKKNKAQKNVGEGYDLSRYSPAVKGVIEDFFNSSLDSSLFPFVKAADSAATSTSASKKAGTSLRSGKPTWQSGATSSSSNKTGPRLIIFVAGGLSFSEMRAVYEATKQFKRQVYIGTSHILKPQEYVEDIRKLRRLGDNLQ